MTSDIGPLGGWRGRRMTVTDTVAAAPIAALSATLDEDRPPPEPGDEVPPGWHWLYALPKPRRSDVGPDGHGKRGGFLPPIDLPRRMFAGSSMTFHRAVRIGDTIRLDSEVKDVKFKEGRTGRLAFVTVSRRISRLGELAIEEEQTLVYRDPPKAGSLEGSPDPAPIDAAWRSEIVPDPVLLFRFSALTFNAHRIHYDRPYATGVEGYPGLVVQGPLIALLLLEACRAQRPGWWVEAFAFRARRPVFDTAPFTVAGRWGAGGATGELWAADAEGWLAMSATVRMSRR